jgi:hypothetical protein
MSALVCVAADVPAGPPADAPKATPEAPTTEEAAPKEATDRQKMQDEALRKEGYKVSEVKGERRYCKKENVLGSRLNARTICWTADQIKANKEDADILREKQGQRQTF